MGRQGQSGDRQHQARPIYLASRAGSYVTGAVIPVDGGLTTTVKRSVPGPDLFTGRLSRGTAPIMKSLTT